MEEEKNETLNYRQTLREQCQKLGGHSYTLRSRWGIYWAECIYCGKRIIRKEKEVSEENLNNDENKDIEI